MTETLTCAVCGRPVYLDEDHVEIDAETVRMDDRNEQESYVLHEECALNTVDAWRAPA